jgi:hypothetical protein
LQWLHKQPEEHRPFVVGVTWIAKCKEAGHKVDEKAYEVDYKKEAVFQRVCCSVRLPLSAAQGTDSTEVTAPQIHGTKTVGCNGGR